MVANRHVLPCARATTIATSTVCKNQEVLRVWILFHSAAHPPQVDCVDGESRRLKTASNDHESQVLQGIIDAIWDSTPSSVTGEIMIVDLVCLFLPRLAVIFEFPNQLFLLAVYAHNGVSSARKRFPHLGDVFKLLVANFSRRWILVAGLQLFMIDMQGESHLFQQSPSGRCSPPTDLG